MEIKSKKRNTTIIIISVLIVIIMLLSSTYTFFTSYGDDTSKTVQAGTLRISYETDALNTVP